MLSLSKAGVFLSCVPLWALWSAAAQGPSPNCTQLLQAQDAKAVAACKAQVDEAESGPASERMARIVADDEYGVALLAIAHQPRQALDSFNNGIALLPASTVKPDSLQWAVAFWHRATAYQQLGQWERAAGDLGTAEDTLTKGIAAAVGQCAGGAASYGIAPAGPGAARGCARSTGQAHASASPASYTIVLLTGGYRCATPGGSSGIINV